MYHKISSYDNDNRYDYPYLNNNLIRKKEDWKALEPNNCCQQNHMNSFDGQHSFYPVQNEIKRFKLNNCGSYIQEFNFWNVKNQYEDKPFLQCETKISCSSIKKQINSPASSLSISSSESTSSDHASLCDSLHKAYQAGQITKSKYRRLIANERERNRMHGLNVAFENLRAVLPSLGSSKQFSK